MNNTESNTKLMNFHLPQKEVLRHRAALLAMLDKCNAIKIANETMAFIEQMPVTSAQLDMVQKAKAKAVAATIDYNRAYNDFVDYSMPAFEVGIEEHANYQQLQLQEARA